MHNDLDTCRLERHADTGAVGWCTMLPSDRKWRTFTTLRNKAILSPQILRTRPGHLCIVTKYYQKIKNKSISTQQTGNRQSYVGLGT